MEVFGRTLCLIALLAQAIAVRDPYLILDITTAHTIDNELKTKAALEALERKYDLRPWTFTRIIMIDESAIPHSHPVLTIHTRHLGDDDALLSTYLHEELHWFLEKHKAETEAAELALMKRYPSVPVGYPDGANDRESTYLHLIDCDLEFHADEALLGIERARRVMEYWATDHYRWVYKTVLTDRKAIDAILKAHGLNQPDASRRALR
jgi:hypothetical protein